MTSLMTFCRLCDPEIQQMKNNGTPLLDALLSFLHHFIAAAEILLDVSSENAAIMVELAILCALWPFNLTG